MKHNLKAPTPGPKCGTSAGAVSHGRRGELTCDQCRDAHSRRVASHARREVLSYENAHSRLRRDRGPASAHSCVDCGGAAQDWSYDHADPNERQSADGPYSQSQDHYQPRCRKCHYLLDHEARPAPDARPWDGWWQAG
jgi:hypothetical protein